METRASLRDGSFNFYKSALCLIAAISIVEFILYLSLASHNFKSATFLRVALTILLLFGLWVQSTVARYLGAVLLLILAGTIVWSFFAVDKVIFSLSTILVFFSGALSLVACYVLLSKRFAAEFSHQQKAQPKYKGILKRAFVIVLVLAVVIATLKDFYHLFPA